MQVDPDNRPAFKAQLREKVDSFIETKMDFDMAADLNMADWWEQFIMWVKSD